MFASDSLAPPVAVEQPLPQSDSGPTVAFAGADIVRLAHRIRCPVNVLRRIADGMIGIGEVTGEPAADHTVLGTLPALYPEWLGDRSFCAEHGVRFPYVAGEMANGIATTRQVAAMADAEMLGFFGAAGLAPTAVEYAVRELARRLHGRRNWGVNLIHSPNEPRLEEEVATLLLRNRVPRISASAYMGLTPAIVRCAATGLRSGADGAISRPTAIFAKVSRPEVAAQFMSPAPAALLRQLVEDGQLTETEAQLAAQVPIANDVTVEADSGGHTDNRPLVAMLPTILRLRDELVRRYRYTEPVRVGAAGGLSTPGAIAAAFAMGAGYVVTGSVNQSSVEAGISADAKAMLAQADIADVVMAPSADMFELGVNVQVLSRGTAFAGRAKRLYEIYRSKPGLDALNSQERVKLERDVLHAPLEEIWQETRRFWLERDPEQLRRASGDPKHEMALIFRWYLGKSSQWAIDGHAVRRTDYQLWCGPAMGAFNRWTAGTFLAQPEERTVVQIGLNLLEGAAVINRVQQLRTFGVPIAPSGYDVRPRRLAA
ncbi:PfaD family polyunsaturated fatty acid/polyketide biosynthesis protein [Nocardia goodfellowii]